MDAEEWMRRVASQELSIADKILKSISREKSSLGRHSRQSSNQLSKSPISDPIRVNNMMSPTLGETQPRKSGLTNDLEAVKDEISIELVSPQSSDRGDSTVRRAQTIPIEIIADEFDEVKVEKDEPETYPNDKAETVVTQ